MKVECFRTVMFFLVCWCKCR